MWRWTRGFFEDWDYEDVKGAMADYRTFSSEPQVLRPMLPRNPIPALEMDPPRHSTWRAIFRGIGALQATDQPVSRLVGRALAVVCVVSVAPLSTGEAQSFPRFLRSNPLRSRAGASTGFKRLEPRPR